MTGYQISTRLLRSAVEHRGPRFERTVETGADRARLDFLKQLRAAELQLSWPEANFVESILRREQALAESGAPLRFSPRERERIDRLNADRGVRNAESKN